MSTFTLLPFKSEIPDTYLFPSYFSVFFISPERHLWLSWVTWCSCQGWYLFEKYLRNDLYHDCICEAQSIISFRTELSKLE